MAETTLTLSRLIKADTERVFDAWIDPEKIQKWWGPGTTTCPEAHVDLRVGGVIRIANLIEDGSIIWINGEFEEVNRPERLVYSWSMGTAMTEATRVTVEFVPRDAGTEVVITHERFANSNVRDRHLMGWGGCLDGLEKFLGEAYSAATLGTS